MADRRGEAPWLPDLCRLRRLATLLGLAELVVLVLVLAPDDARTWTVARFISASGLALWLALAVAVLLCKLRFPISRMPQRVGAVVAVALAGLVAFVGAGVIHALYATIGNQPLGVGFWRFGGGSAAVTVLIVALALRHFYVSDRWVAQIEANARAEADALQARIRPHFLFNSLNAVLSLIRSEPRRAETALEELAELFRVLMRDPRDLLPLADEIALCRQYLDLEKLRLGDRLKVEWEVLDVPSDLEVPPLMLQPLLENAIYHGIEPAAEGGTIRIRFARTRDELLIELANPCLGDPVSSSGNHMALANIRERLGLYYDLEARLETRQEVLPEGACEYHVQIALPYRSAA